jgi:polysaccharide export outer membrane protein
MTMTMKTATPIALALLLCAAAVQAQTPVGTSGTAPAPPLPRPAAPAAAAATSADYRLVSGDKLRIEVYKDAQLSQSLQIRPDGKITLPLVGDVPAAGRTSVELRDAIAKSLQEYMTDPTVTVIVTETTPQVIYVTGEVTKPGSYSIVNGQMSIIQAIAMAGGLTEFANKKDIRVLRKNGTGMETLRFNYKEVLNDETRREPLQLRPGDTVIVK